MTDKAVEMMIVYYEKVEQVACNLFECLPIYDGDRAPSPDVIQMVATFYMNGEITIMEATSYLGGV